MLKRISYPLTLTSPLYPGTPPVSYQAVKSMQAGDSTNTSLVSLSSHTGTHIDVPRHFCPEGKTVREMIGDHRVFEPVFCIDIPVEPGNPLTVIHIRPFIENLRDTAGILVRTGMFRFRAANPASYCMNHPWIHPDVPRFLREECPALRLFGTDTISISSPAHRDEGRACHRAFLCEETPILLLEDLDLFDLSLTGAPMSVTLYPWICDAPDGAPVQAFAEFLSAAAPKRGSPS